VNQHLVSRVLLRRWANHKKGPISCLDLNTLAQHTDRVEEFAAIPDLIPGDPLAERRWSNTVEKRLPHAFQLLDAGKLLEDDQAVATVKACIALHWARSFTLAEMLKTLQPAYADRVADRMLAQVTPTALLDALTGLTIVGPGATELARAHVRAAFDEHLDQVNFTGAQCSHHFEAAQERVEPFQLEVWQASEDEFLLADVPVASCNWTTGAVGPLNGVAWAEADAIFMPLGPRHVVALSKQPRHQAADASTVIRLNSLQVKGAYRTIFFRPDTGLGDTIARALRGQA